MDEDKFALVEKILKDVHNVLTKNAELCSFDIVPVETNFRNKSPVLHIENCLGLESWCVKHVYMYCYSELTNKYFYTPKKAFKVTSLVSDRITKLLNVTLLLNPELTSLWNKRREMVQKALLDKTSELRFSKIVLSRKPKCNDAFSYRRWILDAILKNEVLHSNYTQSIVNEELHICQLAADKSPNNYHSWSHRTWTINQLKIIENYNLDLLLIKEYEFSERWTAKHVSDFSCYHYRQFCIKNVFQITKGSYKSLKANINSDIRKSLVRVLARNLPKNVSHVTEENLLSQSEDSLVNYVLGYPSNACSCVRNSSLICHKLDILFHELVLNEELIRFYRHHETLWYHRRFIVHEIIVLIYEYFGVIRQNGALVKNYCKKCSDWKQKQAKIVRYDCNHVYSVLLFNIIKNNENKFVEERRLDEDNYADRHEKYLKLVEGLNNFL